MNFFDAQDQARRTTRRLVLVYIIATLAIVTGVTVIVGFALNVFATPSPGAMAGPLVATAVITLLFIGGSSLYKTSRLSSGGGRVATDLGGKLVPTSVQDPLRRRLRNVVEEMAIASGVPVPEIYVLEEEQGINAFAAGFSPSDAAIAVTRGTLEVLDRDELQGVIAHEFSHILNGDMKLNIRLMGVLFGIMSLGLVGRAALRTGYYSSGLGSRRNRSHPAVLIIGLGLTILGGIGVFFARMIKASVSRQREYLADASAVQFTRQSEGIAGALKKIGGYGAGSSLTAADPEEVSHMLFGSGSRLAGMFATHPPLADRIKALDKSFKESDFPRVDVRQRRVVVDSDIDSDTQHASFSDGLTAAFSSDGTKVLVDSIADSVGQPQHEHVAFARGLRRSIPESLYNAAHSSDFAFLLAVSLVLDHTGKVTDRQFALVNEQLGAQRAQLVQTYFNDLMATGAEYRLPLLEILFPALKLRPAQELSYLKTLTTRLMEVDGEIELFEFCFYRIMVSNIERAKDPTGKLSPARRNRRELQAATIELLRVIADYGHDNEQARIAAFKAGIAALGPWAQSSEFASNRDDMAAILGECLDTLLGLNSKGQDSLLRAVSATVAYDGKLSISEAELVRAVCATLNYPLPPILAQQ